AAPAGIHASIQTALLELRLHLVGIERRDAERDVPDRRTARRRRRGRRAAAIAAAAAADDNVADVADLALALATLVAPRLPAEERHVERDRLLVVGHLERNVIEPDRLPVCSGKRRRRSGRAAGCALTPILPAAVADLQVEAAGIRHVEALEVAVIVGHGIEAALLQLRFHFFRVPRFDAPAQTVEHA